MKIRFAPWLTVGIGATGLAWVVLSVVLLAAGNTEAGIPALVPGLLLTLIGALYLGPLPYVVIDDSSISVPIVAGGQGRIRIGRGERVGVDGDRIIVKRPGRTQRVPAYRAFAHRAGWDRVTAELRKPRQG